MSVRSVGTQWVRRSGMSRADTGSVCTQWVRDVPRTPRLNTQLVRMSRRHRTSKNENEQRRYGLGGVGICSDKGAVSERKRAFGGKQNLTSPQNFP